MNSSSSTADPRAEIWIWNLLRKTKEQRRPLGCGGNFLVHCGTSSLRKAKQDMIFTWGWTHFPSLPHRVNSPINFIICLYTSSSVTSLSSVLTLCARSSSSLQLQLEHSRRSVWRLSLSSYVRLHMHVQKWDYGNLKTLDSYSGRRGMN